MCVEVKHYGQGVRPTLTKAEMYDAIYKGVRDGARHAFTLFDSQITNAIADGTKEAFEQRP